LYANQQTQGTASIVDGSNIVRWVTERWRTYQHITTKPSFEDQIRVECLAKLEGQNQLFVALLIPLMYWLHLRNFANIAPVVMALPLLPLYIRSVIPR
jgi:hypothetical protein